MFIFRNQKGFSLVELMVVVAIIGILAAIGIPSMQKYMAKARQSEAKTNLASIYTTEKAFYAEYNTYTTDWGAMGYQPEGQLRYAAGFQALGGSGNSTYLAGYGYNAPPSGTVPSIGTYSTTGACDPAGTSPSSLTKACVLTTEADASGLTGADASVSGFTAKAAGKIYKTNQDIWSMSETKLLLNTTPGIM